MTTMAAERHLQSTGSIAQYDVVVVGAGPYGLSAAAHVIGKGLKVAVFGKPLQLWREHMPKGMFLRSHWWATNLSDPEHRYVFDQFLRVSGYKACYPVPIQMFIDYAMWFQKHAVPNIEETYVTSIARTGDRFIAELEDGRVVFTRAVVMALGLYYFADIPAEYAHLPLELVTHSVGHGNFGKFAGKNVAMIGGGQSAVEYSALLNEAGASVQLLARRPIRWLPPDTDGQRTFLDQIRAPRAGIAPGWKNWGLEHLPYLFYRLPQARKDRYTVARSDAAANDWLRDRVIGKVHVNERCVVERIREKDNGVELKLSDNRILNVDHVILATGYRVKLSRLHMLSPTLRSEIHADMDIPILNPWFESSIPGLYFVGLTSFRSFGPLYRFVVGAKAAAARVATAVAHRMAQVRQA